MPASILQTRPEAREVLSSLRRDAAVRAIVRSWRRLTTPKGKARAGSWARTLVACSGGADSSALLLALASALGGGGNGKEGGGIVVGHVLHDLRPIEQVAVDRDAARRLAELVGAPFIESSVSVRSGRARRNLEAAARDARYAALAAMARQSGCEFVATAHHADDELESILMGLMRGAGPKGLGGMRVRARADAALPRVLIIRPMLQASLDHDAARSGGTRRNGAAENAAVTRETCRRICDRAGWLWQEDDTNSDESRLRAALRARVIPELKRLRPGVEARAAWSAGLVRGASEVVDRAIDELWEKRCVEMAGDEAAAAVWWQRSELSVEPDIVVGGVLRRAAQIVAAEGERAAGREVGAGVDRLHRRLVMGVLRALRDGVQDVRSFDWPAARVRVASDRVMVEGRSLS